MKIYYLANARIPTEKAHGLTIVKSCEAFARAGAEVTLFVPRRKNQLTDVFKTYDVEKRFEVRYLPVIDMLRFSSSPWAFYVNLASFYASAFFALVLAGKKNAIVYTRDVSLLPLSMLGMPIFLESHHVFGKRARYFALARRARGIITISQELKKQFVAEGFSKDHLLVSPSGVDLSTFSIDIPQEQARRELSLSLDSKIIAYTGNFTTMGEDKGISDILKALVQLPGILFVAAGGSDKDIARYASEAAHLGVSAQALFAGFQSQKMLALYQRAADMLLMPYPDTIHYRSNMSPVKMFEYMASGRPIIATELPTIGEVLNEKNAIMIPPGSPTSLAQGIKTLLENPDRGRALAEEAKETVKKYTWTERTKAILHTIETRMI